MNRYIVLRKNLDSFFKLNSTQFVGQRVSFENDGIFGTRYPVDNAIRRIRRQSASLATEENIENPIICLEPSDAIIFDLNLADPRENTSFPKYARNSELNTNTDFDNGEFRILEYYITRTNLNLERFIFSFAGVNPNPGPNGDTYVFYDSQNIENLLIVAVQDDCGNYNQVQERDSRGAYSNLEFLNISKVMIWYNPVQMPSCSCR